MALWIPANICTLKCQEPFCKATYETPLTVQKISVSTGIPAMYIEDELPRLEYGDAICKIGNSKYFDTNIYHNVGTRWLCINGIPQHSMNGVAEKDSLSEEDAARLIQNN